MQLWDRTKLLKLSIDAKCPLCRSDEETLVGSTYLGIVTLPIPVENGLLTFCPDICGRVFQSSVPDLLSKSFGLNCIILIATLWSHLCFMPLRAVMLICKYEHILFVYFVDIDGLCLLLGLFV